MLKHKIFKQTKRHSFIILRYCNILDWWSFNMVFILFPKYLQLRHIARLPFGTYYLQSLLRSDVCIPFRLSIYNRGLALPWAESILTSQADKHHVVRSITCDSLWAYMVHKENTTYSTWNTFIYFYLHCSFMSFPFMV